MTVKVTFEFDTNADAAEFLQSLDTDGGTSDAGTGASKPKTRGRPRKDPAPAAAAAPAAAPAVAAAAQPTTAPAASTAPLVPYDALKKPLTDLADVNHEAAVAILTGFGVKQARELKPEQIGPCLAAVQEALGKAQAAPAGLL